METITLTQTVSTLFREKFNREPFVVLAPGRINLIGEHTDYNEGFVMPAAVDKHIVFAAAVNGTSQFTVYSPDFNTTVSFDKNDLKPGHEWFNYLMGVIRAIELRGVAVQGVDVVLAGNIPKGAGMSSSAALCSGFAFALNELFGGKLTRLELAKVAQYAEHHFAGVLCGIMDQYASLFGQKDSALLLDCRSLTHEVVPVHFVDAEILLVDTNVKHSLASSAYNQRRAACEEGVSELRKFRPSVNSLRDAHSSDLELIRPLVGDNVFSKCRFVVNEIARTQKAGAFLRANDLKGFGNLMYETHLGLSQEYEVSCAESDMIVAFARTFPHVYGARQMGGGFGGCVIHWIQKDAVKEYSRQVREKYVATFAKEPDFYSANLCEGVHVIP